MKLTFSVIFLFTFYFGISQNKNFEASILLNPDYKGKIGFYAKPGGGLIKFLQHNFKDEDFISMEIKGQNDSMFYVSVNYSLGGHIANGWIKMSERIGVYSRKDGKEFLLFSKPSVSSAVTLKLEKSNSGFIKVIGCIGTWLKVEMKIDGKIKMGWMPQDEQCANPYTTCS